MYSSASHTFVILPTFLLRVLCGYLRLNHIAINENPLLIEYDTDNYEARKITMYERALLSNKGTED